MQKVAMLTPLQVQLNRMIDYFGYMGRFLKKKKPIQTCVKNIIEYFKNLLSLSEKKRKIIQRVNYEKYMLKKTELILAQNSEHVFLRGKSVNQIR